QQIIAPRVLLHAEENGVVWVSTGENLFRYASDDARGATAMPPPLIRSISLPMLGQQLFGGATFGAREQLVLPYEQNDLRFEVALPYYSGDVRYQYRLEGRDEAWTSWT